MSTWLGYSTWLFNQIIIQVFLWRSFVDVVAIYNQSALRRSLSVMWVDLILSFERLMSKNWFLGEEKFGLKTTTSILAWLTILPDHPTDFGFASSHNYGSQFFKMNHTHTIHHWFCFSLENSDTCSNDIYLELQHLVVKYLTMMLLHTDGWKEM